MYTYMYLTVTRIVCIVCVPSKMCFIKGILLMIIVYYRVMIFKAQYKKKVFLMHLRLYTHLVVADLKYQF